MEPAPRGQVSTAHTRPRTDPREDHGRGDENVHHPGVLHCTGARRRPRHVGRALPDRVRRASMGAALRREAVRDQARVQLRGERHSGASAGVPRAHVHPAVEPKRALRQPIHTVQQ